MYQPASSYRTDLQSDKRRIRYYKRVVRERGPTSQAKKEDGENGQEEPHCQTDAVLVNEGGHEEGWNEGKPLSDKLQEQEGNGKTVQGNPFSSGQEPSHHQLFSCPGKCKSGSSHEQQDSTCGSTRNSSYTPTSSVEEHHMINRHHPQWNVVTFIHIHCRTPCPQNGLFRPTCCPRRAEPWYGSTASSRRP